MKKMNIIYEDKELLVVDKESGLLTIATDKEKDRTLFREASDYVKKQFARNKVFIVHRLDKDTSGLVIFSKNQNKKIELQNIWDSVTREYICVVEGKLPKKKDVLKDYLFEDRTHNVYITKDKRRGKLAITEYEVLETSKTYSLVKINIKTGRKNQIRVQLSNIGNPILGDKKYGSKYNPIRRMCLHAYHINFKLKNREYNFETSYPKEFTNMFKSK